MQKISILLIIKCFTVVTAVGDNQLFPYLPNVVNYTQNDVCRAESKMYETHLENLTMWAYEMLDSSVKSTHSILSGSNTQLGDWEGCININGPFMTQYCLATLTANVIINSSRDPSAFYYGPYESVLEKFRISDGISRRNRNVVNVGVCLPASCSPHDISNSFGYYLENVKNSMTQANVTYSVAVNSKLCQTRDSGRKLDGWDILFCLLCLGLAGIVIFATLYDFYHPKTDDSKHQKKTGTILEAFSARKNFMDLFRCEDTHLDLRILHGLKFISLCVVLFAHRALIMSSLPIINFDYIEDYIRSPFSAATLNTAMVVDTFFTISGLLLSYNWLSNQDKQKNPLQEIFLRYIRLTPSYAFIVLYGATLYYHSGSGPIWNTYLFSESEDCRQNWWISLLYISNYIDSTSICMPILWYLSCDLHLFIMGVFIMVVLTKNKRYGIILISIFLIIFLAAPIGQILYYGISPIIEFFPGILDQRKKNRVFNLIYIKTHNRAPAFILGMIGGIIYNSLKNKTKTLSRLKLYLISYGFLLVKVGCLFSAAVFYKRDLKINAIVSAAYFPFVHAVWAIAVIGIFLFANFGPPNAVKSLLSLPIFIPISKLSYAIYLVHFPIQMREVASTKTIQHASVTELMYVYIADLVLAIFFAFLLHIGIEAPTRHICKLTLRKNPKRKVTSSDLQSDCN